MCDCKKIFPFMEWLYNMKFSLTKLSFIWSLILFPGPCSCERSYETRNY
jgi:predicted metal-binding protein